MPRASNFIRDVHPSMIPSEPKPKARKPKAQRERTIRVWAVCCNGYICSGSRNRGIHETRVAAKLASDAMRYTNIAHTVVRLEGRVKVGGGRG